MSPLSLNDPDHGMRTAPDTLQVTLDEDRNRLFVILPFRARLCELEAAMQAKPRESADLGWTTDKLLSQPLWREETLTLSPDLHQAIRSVLGHDIGRAHPVFWRMNAPFRDSLNTVGPPRPDAEGKAIWLKMAPGYGLTLELTKVAQSRLGRTAKDRFVPLRIKDVSFYLSQTRLGQLVIEISVGELAPSAALLIEVAHALSHGAYGSSASSQPFLKRPYRAGELPIVDGRAQPSGQFSLFDLGNRLICAGASESCMVTTPRAFTFIVATTSEKLHESSRKNLAARLARRLNADYSSHDGLEGVRFATPFETVTHACAADGGAILVSSADGIDFLENYANSVTESVYLKLALLAHKEYHDLIFLSQGVSTRIEHSDIDQRDELVAKLDQISRVQERFLNFRLAHRFSVVSFSSNHELVNKAWRDAMNTDRILSDIDADVRDASTFLLTTQSRIDEQRAETARVVLAKRASWLQATVAFLAVLEGAKALVELTMQLVGWPSAEAQAASQLARAFGLTLPEADALPIQWAMMNAVPILLGAIAGFVTWKFTRRTDTLR